MKKQLLTSFLLLFTCFLWAQENIELLTQFSGNYDFTVIGNTLNTTENGTTGPCTILTSSSAELQLQNNQDIVAAYLYWSGSGGDGDLEIELNGNPIVAERVFHDEIDPTRPFFAAFTDVTELVQSIGNANYTVSEFDLTDVIAAYCPTGTNFGGWAITIIYEDASLPLNLVSVFDGLQSVSSTSDNITIVLDNLNVLDPEGAKIGFLAWEGDAGIAINETLRINGDILSNPPLNPADNAFNGTNTFTSSDQLYNMDIDAYTIEDNINTGDTSATINLTSSQDFVMINNIITVINNQLPDATIEITEIEGGTECINRDIVVNYTVYNENSTDILPANTPIAFYANDVLVGQSATVNPIAIGGVEQGTITVTIPEEVDDTFILRAVVDDTGTGVGIVSEQNEDNNEDEMEFSVLSVPEIPELINLEKCDIVTVETFNLSEATTAIDPSFAVTYYLSEEDALNEENNITNITNFENTENPQTIWIRVEDEICFNIGSFTVEVLNCPIPDAAVELPEDIVACPGKAVEINYIVYNTDDARAPLPAGTPITFYAEGNKLITIETLSNIPIGGNETGVISIILPDNLPNPFTLIAVADDDGEGNSTVFEYNEFNNDNTVLVSFGTVPEIPPLPDLIKCDEGFEMAIFDVTQQLDLINPLPDETVTFHENIDDALIGTNELTDAGAYQNSSNPQIIYVRVENESCFEIAAFNLSTERCEPIIPEGFSPNGDTINDTFNITGLIDIFPDFELKVYSREGNLIYEGRNDDGLWNGIPNAGLLFNGKLVPTGTYYYVLSLNDPKFSEPYLGWVYINY